MFISLNRQAIQNFACDICRADEHLQMIAIQNNASS
jgi:hypothetical protein